MHKRAAHDPVSGRALTQAAADSCCLSSEEEKSTKSSAPTSMDVISSAALGTGVALPASVPALVVSDDWRTGSPIPTTPIPKHVLLSVFLV
jgi:hypothetical protein